MYKKMSNSDNSDVISALDNKLRRLTTTNYEPNSVKNLLKTIGIEMTSEDTSYFSDW